ncbi:alpha/beta hydrolase [Methylobacterium oxalidis]|uniref:Esterase n=1 Tax=Methylobacterium oxalidis TaxID=944322 RepID=A0A512JB55_9HYPH|nr:alpha/beta hydrolase [Methylobacterium oxalidis]GEP07186.1 esterase [Methylobacterium oxalidis]GJE34893.1 Haloalkane dehalogenase [Methylobacterium oxalidis]GLS66023.1 esterase [Methylobacterium oxalidis]
MAQPRNFVLVHGAWYGAWVWQDVLARLRRLGHLASAPTLTGLGERRHLERGRVDLETHVEDVVAHMEMEDLRNVTLVGWSYAGMVVTGVLARIPHRIRDIVYLDAFVPEDGQALVDYAVPEIRPSYEAARVNDLPIPPMPMAASGITDPQTIAFVEPRLVSQPWQTFFQPVKALKTRPDIPLAYVVCAQTHPVLFMGRLPEMQANPAIRTAILNTHHQPMLSMPDETVSVIIGD